MTRASGSTAWLMAVLTLFVSASALAQPSTDIFSGQPVAATLTPGERHTYTIEGTADGSIVVVVSRTGGDFLPMVEVFDPAGRLFMVDWAAHKAFTLQRLPASGTYRIVISDYRVIGGGAYNITVANSPHTQEASANGAVLGSGHSEGGELEPGHLRVHNVFGTAGDTLIVAVGRTSDGDFLPYVEIFAPDGKRLLVDWGHGMSFTRQSLPLTGVYQVVVRDYYGSSGGTYNVGVANVPDTRAADSHSVSINGTQPVTNTLEPGQLSVYSIDRAAGESLNVYVGRATDSFLPMVELFAPDGRRLATDDGVEAHFVRQNLPLTGTYLVVVRDYRGEGRGDYSIVVSGDGSE